MDKRFDKLDEKLDKIGEDISEIKVVQAEQAVDLKYHIRRTDQIEEKLLPLVATKNKIEGAFKVIGMIASFAAFCLGIAKLFFG